MACPKARDTLEAPEAKLGTPWVGSRADKGAVSSRITEAAERTTAPRAPGGHSPGGPDTGYQEKGSRADREAQQGTLVAHIEALEGLPLGAGHR